MTAAIKKEDGDGDKYTTKITQIMKIEERRDKESASEIYIGLT